MNRHDGAGNCDSGVYPSHWKGETPNKTPGSVINVVLLGGESAKFLIRYYLYEEDSKSADPQVWTGGPVCCSVTGTLR